MEGEGFHPSQAETLRSARVSPLTLTPGTRLGSYEILSALGVGGMGEVSRATIPS